MSKILEYFGIGKTENVQRPMEPPSSRENAVPLGLARPAESNRILPNFDLQNGPRPITSTKPVTQTNNGFGQTVTAVKATEVTVKSTAQNPVLPSQGSGMPPKPRSRDRNVQNQTVQSTNVAQAPVSNQKGQSKFDLPFDINQIKQDLIECGQKTFPSAFPSKPIYPDTFPNSIKFMPMDLKTIQRVAEESSKNQNQDNKIAKFYNIKKEVDFYKKYITMNEIKKQKLQQEVQDLKNMQTSFHYDYNNPNDFEEQQHQYMQRQHEIEEELQDLDRLRKQADFDMANGHGVNEYDQQDYWQPPSIHQVQGAPFGDSMRSMPQHEVLHFGDQLYNNQPTNFLDQSYNPENYGNNNYYGAPSEVQAQPYLPQGNQPIYHDFTKNSNPVVLNNQPSNRDFLGSYQQQPPKATPLVHSQLGAPQLNQYTLPQRIEPQRQMPETSYISSAPFKELGVNQSYNYDFDPLQPSYPPQPQDQFQAQPQILFQAQPQIHHQTQSVIQQRAPANVQQRSNPLMRKI